MNALVGPATSGATAAAVANAGKAGVPLVTPSATQDDLTKGQDYLFRATFIDSFQGKIIAKYTTDNLKAKKSFSTTITHLTMRKGLLKPSRNLTKVKS